MSAPLSDGRLADIRASVAAAPHPAPGTWAAGLRDLLAEVDRLNNFVGLQNDTAVAFRRELEVYHRLESEREAEQRADESRAAVANLRIAELNAERDKLRARVAELEAAAPHRFEAEYQGESDAKRRLANCKHCHGARTDASHAAPAEAAAPAELTVYRAWHEDAGLPLGLYTNEAAAREHCDDLLRRENTGRTWDWAPDEDGDLVQVFVSKLADVPEETTGFVVTPLTVAAEYDAEADE